MNNFAGAFFAPPSSVTLCLFSEPATSRLARPFSHRGEQMNTTRNRRFAISAAALAIAMMLGSPAIASARPNPPAHTVELSAEQEADIRGLLSRFGVAAETQDSLVAQVEAGDAWDVYDAAAEPVRVESRMIDGFDYDISHYADGSFSAIGAEVPSETSAGSSTNDADFSTQAITQCSIAVGSGYRTATGCQIDGVWGSVIIGAVNQSYTLVQGGPDKYNVSGYGYQQCLYPTTCTSAVRVAYRSTELWSGGAAYARWQSDVTSPWGSWNVWVQLNVGRDAAWQTNS